MMQDVYIKIFRSINSFDETRPLLPWLKKIAVNTIINYRKNRRIPDTYLDFSQEDFLASKDDTEEIVLFGDTRDIVEKLIAELPEHYRMALILRYHEEMSYEHIADTLDQPLGTVKNSVYRARNLLRKRMQSCGLLEV